MAVRQLVTCIQSSIIPPYNVGLHVCRSIIVRVDNFILPMSVKSRLLTYSVSDTFLIIKMLIEFSEEI